MVRKQSDLLHELWKARRTGILSDGLANGKLFLCVRKFEEQTTLCFRFQDRAESRSYVEENPDRSMDCVPQRPGTRLHQSGSLPPARYRGLARRDRSGPASAPAA